MKHHWKGMKPDPENFFGFVYQITNDLTGKAYIGKKQYYKYKKGKVCGKNNWEYYTGSSKELNADIKKYGKENFTFVILKNCPTRGLLTYNEANKQHKMDVLTKRDHNGERMYYNKQIGAIKFVPKMEDIR